MSDEVRSSDDLAIWGVSAQVWEFSFIHFCSGPYTVRPEFKGRAMNAIKSSSSLEVVERKVLSIRIDSNRIKQVKTARSQPSVEEIVIQDDPFQYLAVRMSQADITALKTRAEQFVQQNAVQQGF